MYAHCSREDYSILLLSYAANYSRLVEIHNVARGFTSVGCEMTCVGKQQM